MDPPQAIQPQKPAASPCLYQWTRPSNANNATWRCHDVGNRNRAALPEDRGSGLRQDPRKPGVEDAGLEFYPVMATGAGRLRASGLPRGPCYRPALRIAAGCADPAE